ncbi:MAG: cytidylate kinase-like family protein [Deltaproteobacteria bacterium]|nr:cytidylate kinase-like family protein [Deltaproteobacteria bacterium]
MPIVTISRGSFSGGRALAEELARKLGCECLESEILGDAARRLGVPVARLKAAMVKSPATLRRFARERDMYLAAITAELCERSLGGDLVYHGHAAHLLMPGVAHVLRVRAIADREFRIVAAMTRMKIDREQAKKFIGGVDADRARWVDFLYGVDWTDPAHYDFVVNLEHVAVPNAAAALCSIAELPEFRPTPSSLQHLRDLLLAAGARVKLGTDPRTAEADVLVRGRRGVLTVQHAPQQAHLAPLIPVVLEAMEGVTSLHCAIASNTLMWVQDHFSVRSDAFAQVLELARRWDAAVELVKLGPEGGPEGKVETAAAGPRSAQEEDGGVVFDVDEPAATAVRDDEMAEVLATLLREGRSGEARMLPPAGMAKAFDPARRYGLVVVGEVFGDKPEAVRTRQARELRASIGDRLGVPVVDVEELRRRLRFGVREAVKVLVGLALVALTYLVVFSHQEAIVRFTTQHEGFWRKVLVLLVLTIAVPLFAYVYGASARLVAKLARFD